MRLDAGEPLVDYRGEDPRKLPPQRRHELTSLARKILREEMVRYGGFDCPSSLVIPIAVRRFESESGGVRMKYPSMARHYAPIKAQLIEEEKARRSRMVM
jgi:hypothetical protein